jgi:hypothetical protein
MRDDFIPDPLVHLRPFVSRPEAAGNRDFGYAVPDTTAAVLTCPAA